MEGLRFWVRGSGSFLVNSEGKRYMRTYRRCISKLQACVWEHLPPTKRAREMLEFFRLRGAFSIITSNALARRFRNPPPRGMATNCLRMSQCGHVLGNPDGSVLRPFPITSTTCRNKQPQTLNVFEICCACHHSSEKDTIFSSLCCCI